MDALIPPRVESRPGHIIKSAPRRTWPESSAIRHATHSNSVVFPAPFRPLRPKISPFPTKRLTSCRTLIAPYRLETPLAVSST